MDFLFFYSFHSEACEHLLQEFPSLYEKAIRVDTYASRTYLKLLKIYAVPTLVIISNDKILQRIIGYQEIRNWLGLTITQVDTIVDPSGQVSVAPHSSSISSTSSTSSTSAVSSLSMAVPTSSTALVEPMGTPIEDLLPLDSNSQIPIEAEMASKKPQSLREMAEEMRIQREASDSALSTTRQKNPSM